MVEGAGMMERKRNEGRRKNDRRKRRVGRRKKGVVGNKGRRKDEMWDE